MHDPLTPGQRYAAIELLRRYAMLGSYDEAAAVVGLLRALTEQGETGSTISVWLSNLPRARGRAAILSVDPDPEPDQVPAGIQHALRPARGQSRPAPAEWLLHPDRARPRRWGRPETGVCSVCGEKFEMNRVGRPLKRCERHRHWRYATKQQQEEQAV